MKKIILCLLFSAIILGIGGWSDGEQSKISTASKEDYASLFPPPLKGWKGSEVRVEESVIRELDFSLFGEAPKRLQLERIYSGLNHPGKLSITLDSYDTKTCALISVIQDSDSAELKQALKKEKLEPFSYKSYIGLRVHDEKNRLIGIVLNITSTGCFGITVETPAGKTDVLDYLEASDLPKILAFLKRH
jgi:hypothetical protein